jgi:hypothetical protein
LKDYKIGGIKMINGIIMQGTTPEQYYQFPFPTEEFQEVSVTYRQKGKIIIKKQKGECTLRDNYIIVSLTQAETLSFSPGEIVEVQIKIKDKNNEVMGSEVYRLLVKEIFDEEEF